jgi:N-acetylneuraminic acid mutarotase
MRWLLAMVLLWGCGDDGGGGGPEPDADPNSPWRDGPPVGGGVIQEHATVALDGKIYVLGGFAGTTITSAVRVFDTATETWSDGEPLPQMIHHATATVVDGTIYVLGALRNPTFDAMGAVYTYNPLTDAGWVVRTGMPTGTQRGAAVAGFVDGRIIVAGGFREGSVADAAAYDPLTDTWDDTVPDLPGARDHGCGGVVGGVLIVAGGRLGPTNSNRVWAFEGGAWVDRAPMPTGRSGTGCGVIDGELIVVGGEGNPDASTGVFPQVEAYDPVADSWRTLEQMPTPRHGMGAAAWDGSLYVPGGAPVQNFSATDVHEILTP